MSGHLSSYEDGYKSTGAFFYLADYGIIMDYEFIDGVVEQIWQGPMHVHGTVNGTTEEGFTRFGSSTQINRRLAQSVGKHKHNGGNVIGDRERTVKMKKLLGQ